MNYKHLRILIVSVAVSLVGVLITQSLWLKKTITVAEKQFDHRADQMLSDVVNELKTYVDTSKAVLAKKPGVCIFDVIDTTLLGDLIEKYSKNHMLDTLYSYALVKSSNKEILFSGNNFSACYEPGAYKVCLSCLWKEEYVHLSVNFLNREDFILGKQFIWVMLSLLFTLVCIGAFIYIIWGIYKQKKISEIKNDFVNNMTHELKTPLSTISVASEILIAANKKLGDVRLEKYAKVVFDENQRMKKLVDKVLNIATLDRELLSIDKELIDLHGVVRNIIENFCFEACTKQVEIEYDLKANSPDVMADKLHLRNILNNLVDNAVKYSGDSPKLKVSTKNIPGAIALSIEDNGKGIPKDAINKVFDKFYRVPSGNIHNVKGFGLGLFYVKSMITAHNGTIEIESNLNKGTTVIVSLPQ